MCLRNVDVNTGLNLTPYGITLLVCAVILLMVGKLPLMTDTTIALKRVVLVAFLVSFSNIVVVR